ncbi:MAG: thioredoxin [Clostridiales bacterium]|nr:thioredoxin [Clostridiales bacterium]
MTIDKLNELKKENKYLLIDFYATWCMPCRMQTEIIHELQAENIDGLNIQKIDVDECEDLATEYGISTIPTLILYKDGEEIKRNVGIASLESIKDWLK